MNSEGGLIGHIPDSKILAAKTPDEITKQVTRLTDFLRFPLIKNVITRSEIQIFGTYNLKLQPFFADVDTRCEVDVNLPRKQATVVVTQLFQHIVEKIEKKKGWFFTDAKAGTYANGEAIHWRAEEIKKGKRDKKQDFNGNPSNGATLKSSVGQFASKNGFNVLLKIDMVAPYFGKYTEITCVYDIKCLSDDGTKLVWFNSTDELSSTENIIRTLLLDTKKQLKKGKYFKVMKRVYALSRYFGDTVTAQFLTPLLISNVSKISCVESDLKTLELIIQLNKPINENVVFGELNIFKQVLSNILDINIDNNEINKKLDITYAAVKSDDKILALQTLSALAKYLHDICNKEVVEFLKYNVRNIPRTKELYSIIMDVVSGNTNLPSKQINNILPVAIEKAKHNINIPRIANNVQIPRILTVEYHLHSINYIPKINL